MVADPVKHYNVFHSSSHLITLVQRQIVQSKFISILFNTSSRIESVWSEILFFPIFPVFRNVNSTFFGVKRLSSLSLICGEWLSDFRRELICLQEPLLCLESFLFCLMQHLEHIVSVDVILYIC